MENRQLTMHHDVHVFSYLRFFLSSLVDKEGVSTGLIAGASAGGIIVVLVIVAVLLFLLCCLCKKKSHSGNVIFNESH